MPAIPATEPPFPPDPSTTGYIDTDDGVRLWWQSHGPTDATDEAPLVCSNGVGVSVFFWQYLVKGFKHSRRVLLWDYRGHGRSAEVDDNHEMTIERCAEDLKLLLDSLGIQQAVLVGHSMGVQVSLEFYRRYRERVAGFIAVLGTAGAPLKTFMGMSNGQPIFDVITDLATRSGPRTEGLFRSFLRWPRMDGVARAIWQVHPRLAPAGDLRRYLHHMSGMSLKTFARMVVALGEHSAWDLLPEVRVPTLIIGGQLDAFSPVDLSNKMNSLLPDSELLMLPDATHAGLIEQPDTINLAVRRFLRRRIDT